MMDQAKGILSAELKGSEVWGGGVNQWTVYVIEVRLDDNSWVVYRRYSSFEALHNAMSSRVDAMTRTYLNKNFPERELGSFFGTFGFTVDKRVQVLKRYLGLLLMHPQLVTDPILMSFLDTEDKGICGVARAVGVNGVNLEGFVDMSLPDYANLVWTTCYMVLTKDGKLYALEDIYFPVEQAFLTVDLKLGGKVSGTTDKCDITTGGSSSKSFSIKFKKEGTLASWIRALSTAMSECAVESLPDMSFGYSSSSARSAAKPKQKPQQREIKTKKEKIDPTVSAGSIKPTSGSSKDPPPVPTAADGDDAVKSGDSDEPVMFGF